MSTTVKITIEGGKTIVSGDDVAGGLQVASSLSSTPQSVTDASGTPSGLQLAAVPAAVSVATGLEVQGGATVTGGLAVDNAVINGELAIGSVAVADLTAETVNVAAMSTLAGGATVTGGLTVDNATINGELAIGSVAVTGLTAETVKVARLSTGGLTVGDATINGYLAAGGAAVADLTAESVNVVSMSTLAGGATVTGGLTADNATVTGQLTVHAAETVVQMFSNTPLVTAYGSPGQGFSQEWTANTDGFLIAVPGSGDSIGVEYGSTVLRDITSGLVVLPIACGGSFLLWTGNGMTNFSFFGMGALPPTLL